MCNSCLNSCLVKFVQLRALFSGLLFFFTNLVVSSVADCNYKVPYDGRVHASWVPGKTHQTLLNIKHPTLCVKHSRIETHPIANCRIVGKQSRHDQIVERYTLKSRFKRVAAIIHHQFYFVFSLPNHITESLQLYNSGWTRFNNHFNILAMEFKRLMLASAAMLLTYFCQYSTVKVD